MKAIRIFAAFCAVCCLSSEVPQTKPENQLWEYRNLGKAFYENPDTHGQAVEALHHALELAPDSVRERINYGLALLRAGKNEAAVAELLKAQQQDATLPYTWFNLGIYYKHNGDYDKALVQLRQMIKLVPDEPKSHYNVAAILKAQGNLDAAIPEFQAAEKLDPYLAGPHFQLFTIYQRQGSREQAVQERKLFEDAKKRNEGAAVPEDMEWCFYAELYDPPDPRPYAGDQQSKYKDVNVASGWDAGSRMLTIDSQGSGQADLLVWSGQKAVLYRHGVAPISASGLEAVHDIRAIAAGDYDNDGLTDLAIVTASGATLYRNTGGSFAKAMDLPGTAGTTAALWVDYDHDYDLDLFLFGPKSVLMRNNGNNTFEDQTAKFPFVNGQALDAAIYASRGDTAGRDIVVTYADRPGTIYVDHLNEVFQAHDIPQLPAGAAPLSVQDVNHDGLLDLVAYTPKPQIVLNASDKFIGGSGDVGPSPVRADFNGDNRQDYARILADGTLHVYMNDSPSEAWSTVRINGIKNLKLAPGATVEMKSGAYYDKRIYAGLPIAFALDSHADADTIRITWPNGLIQNEVHQKANAALKIDEAQRLSGSCPMIFTWNGKEFQFITDVLGVAPLGASSGDGHYFPVDHREYIQIPSSALQAVNGQFQVHITEELHEVSYLDKVQLIAVDHDAKTDIYTNEKFKSPPYPDFRLFGAARKIHPVRATEGNGRDATGKVAKIDLEYPDTFSHNEAGVASLHALDLDFGSAAPENSAALVLNGWVDWADGSTFLGASQNGTGLIFPYLQVKDASGKWQTVVQDMGIPSGKPKTIVVDLTNKFLSPSREVRIVTNLCVYWDEIFLIDSAAAPNVRLTPVTASSANLNFRGFSRVVIDPNRQQPERFLYDQVSMLTNWNPTPGNYTRYGDVLPLVTDVDDKLTVMGSGDELKLTFPAMNLPALPSGWKRDYLLLVDGWAKDADANTAFSQSVLPLPFHGMSAYPYGADEHFPSDTQHDQYVRNYLTRPALRLIRPLAPTGEHQGSENVATNQFVTIDESRGIVH